MECKCEGRTWRLEPTGRGLGAAVVTREMMELSWCKNQWEGDEKKDLRCRWEVELMRFYRLET